MVEREWFESGRLTLMPTEFTCPVCAFEPLEFRPYADYTGNVPAEASPPYDEWLGTASYGVCPKCGFEFGNDDNPGTGANPETFAEYHREWLTQGGTCFDGRDGGRSA